MLEPTKRFCLQIPHVKYQIYSTYCSKVIIKLMFLKKIHCRSIPRSQLSLGQKCWYRQTGLVIRYTHVIVYLFGIFCPTREFFTHLETSSLPVKGCFFTYARHLWTLSSEGSLACHTYCDTGHPFILVLSEDP